MLGSCCGFVEHQAHSIVYAYTNAERSIPKYKISTADPLILEQKLAEFQSKVNRQESATLILTADDLNTLVIEANSNLVKNAHFEIQDNQIVFENSIALEGFPGFSGRFLNTVIFLNVSLKNNNLLITSDNILVGNQEVPEILMEDLQNTNLAENLIENKQLKNLVQKVQGLEVKNNQIIIER